MDLTNEFYFSSDEFDQSNENVNQSKKTSRILPKIEKCSVVESLLNNSYPRLIAKENRRFVNVINTQLILPSLTQSTEQFRTKTLSKQILWKSNVHLIKTPIKPKLTFPIKPTDALKYYTNELSRFERNEIFSYNEIYYVGCEAKKIDANHCRDYDDENGFYREIIQDQIHYRYEICQRIGQGSFGIVLRCFDHQIQQFIALKILRRKKRFRHQALVEISILNHLNTLNHPYKSLIVQMKDYFSFRQHICITFQLLGINLYELIQKNAYQGFPFELVRTFSKYLLKSLQLLNEQNIIHCDLKPENILLRKKGSSRIKLIDFGSSCFQSSKMYTYIQSRYYRAPEIILGIVYTTAIDMWSFACIIVELLTGSPLFPGRNEEEQIFMFIQLIGQPNRTFLQQGKRTNLFFDDQGKVKVVSKKSSFSVGSFEEVLRRSDENLVDLLRQCLQWDPSQRLTAEQALNHPLFNK